MQNRRPPHGPIIPRKRAPLRIAAPPERDRLLDAWFWLNEASKVVIEDEVTGKTELLFGLEILRHKETVFRHLPAEDQLAAIAALPNADQVSRYLNIQAEMSSAAADAVATVLR